MTTTMAEPEWDQDTRELVLAHDQVQLCPRCGLPPEICQDPERQFDWRVSPPVRCHVMTALRSDMTRFTEESNPVMSALIWALPHLDDGSAHA
jgi:hypothetical protein